MTDLVAFLRARLDDDQQRAERMDHFNIDDGGYYSCPVTRSGSWGDLPTECDCNLEARRRRDLAEVEAKRRIVELYSDVADCDDVEYSYEHATGRAVGLGEAVRLLALPYADHSDYDPALAPAPEVTGG